MLENVFSVTKVIGGEKQLSSRYEPANSAECCISEYDRLNVLHHLETEKCFAVHYISGSGATVCIRCIANEQGTFFVHELSCSMGCSEVVKLVKQNMKNVLLALQQQTKKILFLIKDIDTLKRNEKAQLFGAIEDSNVHAILFFNSSPCTNFKTIQFSPLTFYDKMIHLCWICAEESLDLTLEEIEKFANFTDLRNAINSMSLKCKKVDERDHASIDNFSKFLYAHESLGCADMNVLANFSDLLSLIDIAEYKPTRYWFIDYVANYVDSNDFEYENKQSFVARNAQLTHRVACLKNACKTLSINTNEIQMYGALYKYLLLKHINPLKSEMPNYKNAALSLYTIAKIGASAPQCKHLKRTLELR